MSARDQAARELPHPDYRIRRRPLALKRRKDRKAWQRAQATKLDERLLRAERDRETGHVNQRENQRSRI